MSNPEDFRREFVEELYKKTQERPEIWSERGEDSFEIRHDKLKVHLDRSAFGDEVAYVVWVFGSDGIIERIDGSDLGSTKPNDPDMKSYNEVLRYIFKSAQNLNSKTKLKSALELLRSI